MVRNGRANVGVTFTEEAACTQTGATCRINSECCSKKCTAGLCIRRLKDCASTTVRAAARGN